VKDITDGCAPIVGDADIAPARGLACSDLGGQRLGAGHCRKRFQSTDDVRRADRVMLQKICAQKHVSTLNPALMDRGWPIPDEPVDHAASTASLELAFGKA
jgi:hypothetical protein